MTRKTRTRYLAAKKKKKVGVARLCILAFSAFQTSSIIGPPVRVVDTYAQKQKNSEIIKRNENSDIPYPELTLSSSAKQET